ADVGHTDHEALGQLAVEREVPLLRARPFVAVERPVQDALAVVVVGPDERGRGEAARREPILQEERRLQPAETAAERSVLAEAVLADPASPSRIERAVVEDPPAGAHER